MDLLENRLPFFKVLVEANPDKKINIILTFTHKYSMGDKSCDQVTTTSIHPQLIGDVAVEEWYRNNVVNFFCKMLEQYEQAEICVINFYCK